MPGLRGVGKTTIIYQLFSYLLNEKQIPKNRILYLNLENLKMFLTLILKNTLMFS